MFQFFTYHIDIEDRSHAVQHQEPESSKKEAKESKTGIKMSMVVGHAQPNPILFQTSNAYLACGDENYKIKIVYDTCSVRSYVTSTAPLFLNKSTNQISFEHLIAYTRTLSFQNDPGSPNRLRID